MKEHPWAVHLTRSPIREVGTHSKHSLVPRPHSAKILSLVVWRSGRELEMIYDVSDIEDMQRESRRDIIEPTWIFNPARVHSYAIDGKHNMFWLRPVLTVFRMLSMNKAQGKPGKAWKIATMPVIILEAILQGEQYQFAR